jgi:hypothetical protein
MLLKYNPKKITGSWSGSINGREFAVQFSGFMDGTFFEAEYDEDQVTKHVGGQGDATAVINANLGALFTVTLVQGSPVNGALSLLIPNARRNFLPTGAFSFEDLNGTTIARTREAWIKKVAKIEYGKDVSGRVWTFDCGEAELLPGAAENF